MNNPTEKHNGGNGATIEQSRVPTITIIFDPQTYQVVERGSVPNLEFGRYMLQSALDATEKQIRERDNPRIIPAGGVLDFPQGKTQV
jgi:hypothetical protein